MRLIELGMKLDIGAGNPAEGENQADNGYVLQDVEEHKGIDIVCDIRDLDKHVEPNFCSEIRASHVLEHFHSKELNEKILPMLKTLLKENGILNIIVPNFEWHCQLVLQGHDERAVYMAFGRGNDVFDLHFTGWTGRLAYKWLEESGFEIIDFYADTCLHIKCKKKL